MNYLKRIRIYFALILFVAGLSTSCQMPPKSMEFKLRSIPGVVDVNYRQPDSIYKQSFEVWFEQPIDHKDPNSAKFRQKVYVAHVDDDSPVVVEIQGYNIWSDKAGELSKLLNANQISIEYRFFDHSRPDSIPWDKLTIWQAATDQHEIINAIKRKLYRTNKWISTGISKGGQSTIFHRYFYPNDVDVSVPYVAPLNLAKEDPRIYHFLNTVGSDAQRKQILDFQKRCFQHKPEFVGFLKELAEDKKYTWKMGVEKIMDYYILEYSFAFWQWGTTTFENIPKKDADPKEMFDHLMRTTGISFFEDQGVIENQAFFWAALTEIGIYGYQVDAFSEYLDYTEDLTFDFTAPEGTSPVYNTQIMTDINNWLQENGNNLLYIYGGLDTWGSTGVEISEKTNAVKMVLPDGHHGTRIHSFPKEDQEKIYKTLENWLDISIQR